MNKNYVMQNCMVGFNYGNQLSYADININFCIENCNVGVTWGIKCIITLISLCIKGLNSFGLFSDNVQPILNLPTYKSIAYIIISFH